MARYLTYEKRKDYLWILVGTAVMALSTNLFFVPENLVCGGFTGISIIIKYLTAHLMPGGFPLWATNIILNVPLLLFSIRLRGWSFVRKTLGATLLFSAWLYIIPVCPVITGDLILTAVFGGATMGAGLGLVFLGKSTTGGTDTVAAYAGFVRIESFYWMLEVALSVSITTFVEPLSFWLPGSSGSASPCTPSSPSLCAASFPKMS